MRKSGLSRLKKRRGISRFAGQSPKIGDTAFLCEAVPLQTKTSPFGAFRGTNTAQAVKLKALKSKKRQLFSSNNLDTVKR